jgi:hypothetical protein
MKKSLILSSAVILLIPFLSHADVHRAESLSPQDIQRAVDAAKPGDWVVLPSGVYFGFNSTVYVPNGISIRGQGKDNTILCRTAHPGIMFRFNDRKTSSKHIVEIRGFSLSGFGAGLSLYHSGMRFRNMPYLIIHDLEFKDFSSTGIIINNCEPALIYSCSFSNIYPDDLSFTGYGVAITGNQQWDDPKPPLGTRNAVFIEDCIFETCKHGVSSSANSHVVVRHCTLSNPIDNRYLLDAHGHDLRKNSGSNTWEFYENTLTGSDSKKQTDWGIVVRGGSGVIWGNIINHCDPAGFRSAPKAVGISIDNHGIYPDDYPDPFQVKACYIWDNRVDGNLLKHIFVTEKASDWCKKNRDYFLKEKPGYLPFPYPHPRRLTRESEETPKNFHIIKEKTEGSKFQLFF